MFVSHAINAARVLRPNSLRSQLTMLGIIIGVAAVVSVMAVGAGAQRRVGDEMRMLGANLLLIKPGSADLDSAATRQALRSEITMARSLGLDSFPALAAGQGGTPLADCGGVQSAWGDARTDPDGPGVVARLLGNLSERQVQHDQHHH
jgi:hypothetical protein